MDQPETGGGAGGHGSEQVRLDGPQPNPEVLPRRSDRVLFICGGTQPGLLPADIEEPGAWEIWGLNAIRAPWTKNIKWDRWFNLHRHPHLVRDWAHGIECEVEWANENPTIPFYVLDDWAGRLPNPRMFPRHMGFPRDDYHCSSFDMMIALAITLGMKEISLHGIDMDAPHIEPISARACIEYWVGYAEALGIKVKSALDCHLLCQYFLIRSDAIYGWDDVHITLEHRREPDQEPTA